MCICVYAYTHATSVVDVMKMENIVPRVEIEPTALAFKATVLSITPLRFPYVTTMPTPTCMCSSLPERSLQSTTHTHTISSDHFRTSKLPLAPQPSYLFPHSLP